MTTRPIELNLANWDLGGPVSQWAYAHTRELFPTMALMPGHSATDLVEEPCDVPAMVQKQLDSGLVDAAVVLMNGRIVHRSPDHAERPRLLMSVSKVISSLLIGLLEARGDLRYEESIHTFIPDLGDQWRTCRLLDVLDMASGVVCPEVGDPGAYLDPSHPFFQFEASLGWRPRERSTTPYELLLGLDRVGDPGTTFAYTSVNTFLLAWVVEAVTGSSYADAVQHLMWDHLALGDEAALALSAAGTAVAYGGLIMTTTDLARLGTAFTPSGPTIGHQLTVPAAYLEMLGRPRPWATSQGHRPARPAGQWNWVTPEGDMFKSGFGGQGLFVSPRRNIVIAFTGTPNVEGCTNDLAQLCPAWADSLTVAGEPFGVVG